MRRQAPKRQLVTTQTHITEPHWLMSMSQTQSTQKRWVWINQPYYQPDFLYSDQIPQYDILEDIT